MRVHSIESRDLGDRVELLASVQFEEIDPAEYRYWFLVPHELASVDTFGDSLFVATLLAAMTVGERLTLEVPVSRDLVRAAREILTPRVRRWGWDPWEIEIDCPVEERARPEKKRGTLAFFSGGVDTWYSAIKNREVIDSLVFIRGVDIRLSDGERWPLAHELARESASLLDRPLITVETNINDIAIHHVPRRAAKRGVFFDSFMIERHFGSMLAATALLFQRDFDRVIAACQRPYEFLGLYGSHWMIEPTLDTDAMRFVLDGGEAGRIDKVRALGEWMPESLERLRVCFEKDRADLNCGECEKCIRTMLEMRITGNEPRIRSFSRELDLHASWRRPLSRMDDWFWNELEREAAARKDAAVVRYIHQARRTFRWVRLGRRMRKELGAYVRQLLSRRRT